MHGDKYDIEIMEFHRNFASFQKNKIVLYGIGRYTATLVSVLSDYNLVGLMDKDPDNVGKIMYGLPILSKGEAKKRADIIIINTSGSYWDIIFHRIMDLDIPVYYKNGQKAELPSDEFVYQKLSYWNETYEDLEEKIKKHDIISFDFYDTLFLRKTYLPQDIFEVINYRIQRELGININFPQIRSCAAANCGCDADVEEIYQHFFAISGIDKNYVEKIKQIEIDTEQNNIVPRSKIMQLLSEALILKKDVYIITDMYLPMDFFQNAIKKCGIDIPEGHIWISSRVNKSKRDGGIWDLFYKEVVRGKKALHIGDNIRDDIELAREYGLDAYYIMSGRDMLANSSFHEFVPEICTPFESAMIGMLICKLFNDPFVLSKSKGKIFFQDRKLLGYALFGPVILTFLVWLTSRGKAGKDKFHFLARDGYFLIEDYKYLKVLINNSSLPDAEYLLTSRQLATIAALGDSDEEIDKRILEWPYSGTLKDYLADRFATAVDEKDSNAQQQVPQYGKDGYELKQLLLPYKKDIIGSLKMIRSNYKNYLETLNIREIPIFIDLSYYGHTQEMLSEILGIKSKGYYFVADLSKDNICNKENEMDACFQWREDTTAKSSNIHIKCLLLESFLTAPYGMIRRIDNQGNIVCDLNKDNQKFFDDKVEINDGVKEFIKDFLKQISVSNLDISEQERMFIDKWYGLFANGMCEMSDEIKRSFFNDNAMIHRNSNNIFE